MKKLFLLLILKCGFWGHAQFTLIPDTNFEKALITLGIDSGMPDGKVLTNNIKDVVKLDVPGKLIEDLTGIEDFVGLNELIAHGNRLTKLDVSKNILLEKISCWQNRLSKLDLSKNPFLKELDVSNNQITEIDVSKNPLLLNLTTSGNQISSLNISTNSNLWYLDVSNNLLTSLNLTNQKKIEYLLCNTNKLTTLNLSENKLLTRLFCYNNKLTALDISKNENLSYLECGDNSITSLEISKNKVLENLLCYNNNLSKLDLRNGNNTLLKTIYLVNNPNLSCINVDNKTYSDTKWSSFKDNTASFSQTCNNTIINTSITSTAPPSITANGAATYCPNTEQKIASNVVITHDPSDPNTDAVYVQITSGYLIGEDFLKLNTAFAASNPSISSSFNSTEGKLKIYSSITPTLPYSDFEKAIEAVEYYNSTPNPFGSRSFSISIGTGALSYLPRNGHYYEYVEELSISWTRARDEAATKNYYGLQGYLATLTAADEAQLAGAQAPGTGWIGGSDAETEGTWKWVTGPEGLANGGTGTVFWRGASTGTATAPDFYANWNNNEPNNNIQPFKPSGEHYAHITAPGIGKPGAWNDLSNDGDPPGNYHPRGYIVEYGGMPGDPELQLTASTTLSIAQITSTTPASRCGSGTLELHATALNGTIDWYDAPTGGNLLATNTTVFTTPNLTTTTDYYAEIAGCESTRTKVTATVNVIPTLNVTNTTVPLCETEKATLTATTDIGSINWYASSTDSTILGTGNQFTTPTITQNTTYYAEAVNNDCNNGTRTAINVVVYATPDVTDETVVLCKGSDIELNAGLSGMRYLWSTGATSQEIIVNTAGTYTVEVTNENNCSSKKTIIVTEHDIPEINYIDVNETTVVIYLKKEEAYFEYSIDGIDYQNSNTFFNVPSGLQTAYVREINSCGMDSKDFIVLIAPKFFTPNNDSFNDRWEINELIYYPKSSVTIFDRYGKLIAILNANNTSWDGTYHKIMLPADDYWYVLKIDDSSTEKRGHFSLKR